MSFTETIWANDHTTQVQLRETAEGLELTADVGDEETTVVLHPDGVRKLRLALARFERARAKAIVALVAPVGDGGRLLPDSMVTVNGQSWPVPDQYGTVMWMHRVGRTLRDNGWSVTGEARPSTEPGVYEVPVEPIETGEG